MGAVGTDTGGSIRHPAAVCGIVGMKATYGRVSSFGVLPLAASLDHAGPMTRTVRDNAIMLQAMAGHDARDPTSVNRPVPDFSAAIGQGIRGLRIGVPRRFQASVPHDPEVLDAFEAALRVLHDLGAVLCDIEVDGLADAESAGSVLLIREAWLHHRADLERTPGLYGASFRARLAPGATFTEARLQAANAACTRLRRGYDAVFAAGIDAIVSTARESPADTMASLYAETIGHRPATNRMYNITGMPAMAMPMGFTRAGLPTGLQFAGPLWSEPLLYRVAAAYEDATPWHARHPSL
jgi:aspartyl-tRNA(Asn)/glutamyl-tRNA(Gln) amidotransferase subunit A